jgi:ABC-2 type transport system permease protein
MNKTLIIIKREYLHAIRKKSFLIMTILGPILMACFMCVPAFLLAYDNEKTVIAVADETHIFAKLDSPTDKDISFTYPKEDIHTLKKQLAEKKYDAVLYIPYNQFSFGGMVYSVSSLKTGVMSNILAAMKRNLSDELLISEFNINQDSLTRYVEQHTQKISLGYTHIDEHGVEQTKSSHIREIQRIIGLAVGVIIYMFVFMYCSMVLRGVLEEKTNRIVEVIISSVKPIQLMVGKIVGVALIALTQVGIWTLLLGIFSALFPLILPQVAMAENNANIPTHELFAVFSDINVPQLLFLFLFYFIAGYFLYASLYAAVGSAVDNDTDSQQLVLPITMPLILSLLLLTYVVNHPDGQVAFWFSMIPFTSPIVMMVRLPGAESIPMWEILLSCGILLLTCFAAAYAAAKVYRTGILMYGKKNTYKELWKWIKYRN